MNSAESDGGRARLRLVRHPDSESLAAAVAARLLTGAIDAIGERGVAHLVLTGGGAGTRALSAVFDSPARHAVDWSAVHLWWGDERFLPEGHPDRNAVQAHAAMIDQLPIPPENVHPMPADPGDGDAQAAADHYQAELAEHVGASVPADGADLPALETPTFDVLMLGVGPDGHVASLFPDHPSTTDPHPGRSVIPVHGSPKPPPTRLSLTMPAIRSARRVWLIAAGEEKAPALRLARSGPPAPELSRCPAAWARGTQESLLLGTVAALS